MIIFLINDDDEQRSVLYMVIEKENLDRMAEADPVTIPSLQAGGMIAPIQFPANLSVVVCYEPDKGKLMEAARSCDAHALLSYLRRGFHYEPGDGIPIAAVPLDGGRGFDA